MGIATIAERATTDVHVLRNREPLFNGLINLGGGGPRARYRGSFALDAGDTLDFAVGFGNGDYGADTTALAVRITAAGGAAYALRSRESGLSVQADVEPGFVDAYHVGVLADLSDRYMQEFEAGLELLKQKRLDRPPWGMPERKRLRRLENAK